MGRSSREPSGLRVQARSADCGRNLGGVLLGRTPPRRSQGVVSRRDAEIAEGKATFHLVGAIPCQRQRCWPRNEGNPRVDPNAGPNRIAVVAIAGTKSKRPAPPQRLGPGSEDDEPHEASLMPRLSRCGAPTDGSPRRQPWDPHPEGLPAPAGRKTWHADLKETSREDAKTRRRQGVVSRRDGGSPRGNADASRRRFHALPTPTALRPRGLAEERGQPWVCSARWNQPHGGCGHH